MKNKIITKADGTRIRLTPRQIHTRKIDRLVARHIMAKQHHRQIFKPGGAFSEKWRGFVPD